MTAWCQAFAKTRYTVFLEPVIRTTEGALPSAKPAKITTARFYRWKPPGGGLAACESDTMNFFELRRDEDGPRVFSTIKLFVRAQRLLRSGQTPTFAGSMNDQFGRDVREQATKDPSFAASLKVNNPEALAAMNDWKAVLIGYPIDRIGRYFAILAGTPAEPAGSITFNAGGGGPGCKWRSQRIMAGSRPWL